MQKVWAGIAAAAVIGIVGVLLFTNKAPAMPEPTTNTPEAWLCNGDGFICPDGSLIGRTGPTCQFAACPSPDATSTILTTYLGGRASGLHLTINPQEVISDSRCAADVQCIWAGTVEVRTVLSTQVAHGEHVFKLGEPRIFGEFVITLTEVTPAPTTAGETIPVSSYRFTFEVKKH